jgi:competence protein ComEA
MFTPLKTLLTAALLAVSFLAFAAPVDINQADAKVLAKNLNGIGQTKAEAIVAYREAHGPFRAAEDLVMVKGIGAGILNKNRELIQVSGQ